MCSHQSNQFRSIVLGASRRGLGPLGVLVFLTDEYVAVMTPVPRDLLHLKPRLVQDRHGGHFPFSRFLRHAGTTMGQFFSAQPTGHDEYVQYVLPLVSYLKKRLSYLIG